MPSKRGAQFGNQNAFKHGFYSQHFKAEERRILSHMSLTDPSGEIELVRIQLKRFLEAQDTLPRILDLESQTSLLHAVTLSTESINSMIRTQIVLSRVSKESDEIREKLFKITPEDENLSSEV